MLVKTISIGVLHCVLTMFFTLSELMIARLLASENYCVFTSLQGLFNVAILWLFRRNRIRNVLDKVKMTLIPGICLSVFLVLESNEHHGWPVACYHLLVRSSPIFIVIGHILINCREPRNSRTNCWLLLVAVCLSIGSLRLTEIEFVQTYYPNFFKGVLFSMVAFVALSKYGISLLKIADQFEDYADLAFAISAHLIVWPAAMDIVTGAPEFRSFPHWLHLFGSKTFYVWVPMRFLSAFGAMLTFMYLTKEYAAMGVVYSLSVPHIFEFWVRYALALMIISTNYQTCAMVIVSITIVGHFIYSLFTVEAPTMRTL